MIDERVLRETLAAALATGGEYADVFAESRWTTAARLDDGRIQELSGGIDRGAGVRVIRGRATAYAYTNRLERDALLEAARTAATALPGDAGTAVADLTRVPERTLQKAVRPPGEVAAREKAEALQRADDAARGSGAAVSQVTAILGDMEQDTLIATSEGLLTSDRRTRMRLACIVVATRDGVAATGHRSAGGTLGYELLEREPPEEIARAAARQAITMLDARPAPAGEMPVVLAPGGGGVLFHEACGHGLEADGIEKGTSLYAGRLGERIGSDLVDGIDDASLPGAWGSFGFDDEGAPSSRTVLFEGGILTSFLTDRLHARLLDLPETGNGRRQSYAHVPVPRMTNTFLAPKDTDPAAIIADTPRGLYAASFSGGQVNPASGDFVFGLTEAYLIERGEVTVPVRGATLAGNGPEILRRIDAVGNDFDLWVGNCGKDGQMVPANVGLPTVRVGRLVVGGTGG